MEIWDALRVWYYKVDGKLHLRMSFNFCEGEQYYKYSGWKRIFSEYVLYDAPLSKVSMNRIHEILKDLIKTWYESHLKRDRDIILNYVKNNFEKGETITK